MHKIGNIRALSDKLIETAERDGNEAEHQLGIELVYLARREGLTEDQIIDALSAYRFEDAAREGADRMAGAVSGGPLGFRDQER